MRSSISISLDQSEVKMEQREPTKSRLKLEMELDRFSNLPSDVIENILSCLPIREAVRTSVLSSNWRYRSAMLRHLVFDDRCVSTQKHITFADIIDHVLLGHIGPMPKFSLSHRRGLANWDIDRWILHLSRNSVKEVILRNWGLRCYIIPSYLFSCQAIIHLELFSCVLKPPPTFKGFRNLKSLLLKSVTVDQDVFQNLIACCPLLEKLTLSIPTFDHLKIDAPNLQFLDVEGGFKDVTFENTLNLADVCIRIYPHKRTWVSDNSNLVKFLVQLPLIQRLKIGRYILRILVVGSLSPKLPKPCLYLKFLSVMVNFKDPGEVLTVLCLLRSSPAVQEIALYLGLEEEQDFYAHQEVQAALSEVNSLYGNWIFPFTQLRLVKIYYISDVKTELDFIRFLLLNSPVLEKMIVTPDNANDSLELMKQLLRLRRASVHSEIIFLEPRFIRQL